MRLEKVVIIGGGPHAKVIIDILQQVSHQYEIVGYVSLYNDGELLGVPYLGDDSVWLSLKSEGINYFTVAVGDNRIRKKLFEKLVAVGLQPLTLISPAAYVSPSATIGQGVVVMPGAVINTCVEVGQNVIVNTRASIDHDCIISSHTHIAPGTTLAGSVFVGEGSFLGTGSSVIPEIRIEEWVTIGAGSVVISNISSNVTVVGVPAKKILKGMK